MKEMAIAVSSMSKMRLNRVFSTSEDEGSVYRGGGIVIQNIWEVGDKQRRIYIIYYNIIYTITYLFHSGYIHNRRTKGSNMKIYDRQGDMLRISK